MPHRSLFKLLMCGVAIGTAFTAPPAARGGLVVKAGYDLLTTDAGDSRLVSSTSWGFPYGTYDFGGTIGTQNTGQTDTIIQRLSDASIPGSYGMAIRF